MRPLPLELRYSAKSCPLSHWLFYWERNVSSREVYLIGEVVREGEERQVSEKHVFPAPRTPHSPDARQLPAVHSEAVCHRQGHASDAWRVRCAPGETARTGDHACDTPAVTQTRNFGQIFCRPWAWEPPPDRDEGNDTP